MIKMSEKLLWLVIAVPYIYVAIIWNDLPDKLPMHFNLSGLPDRMGNKQELFFVLLIMATVTLFSFCVTAYAYKLDPKKNASVNKEKMKKMALAVAFFTLAVSAFTIYSITKGSVSGQLNMVFAGVGILYSILGNYMHTLKPNYFAGIRVPWTLNNAENWRRTHLMGGKLWFWGGILLAVLCILSTPKFARFFFLITTLILCIIPTVYSYLLFKRMQRP